MATILVVDDDEINRTLLVRRLTPEGHTVRVARDGLEALAAVEEAVPDLVLLDVMMPHLDGFDVCRRLRERPHTRAVPVILLTALRDREDRLRGLEAGADDFITKPFDGAELTARVRSLLRVRYFQGLAAQRELVETAIGDLADGIVVTEPDWTVVVANRRARHLLGLDEEGVRGLDLAEHLRAFDVRPALTQLLLTEANRFEVQRGARPDLVLDVRFAPVRDPDGEPLYYTLALRDVTAERQAARLRLDFFSLTAHKLRTPLTILKGLVEMCADPDTPAEMAADILRELAPDVMSKLNEVSGIVDDLVVRDRLETLAASRADVETALGVALDSAAEQVRATAGRTLAVACDAPSATLKMARSDLELVLRELIENATKFCDRPSAEVTVSATPAASGDGLVLLVADNGRGIPHQHHENVFRECFQVDEHAVGNVPGLGLGLALVRRVVEAYGGQIEIVGSSAEGTRFRLRLP